LDVLFVGGTGKVSLPCVRQAVEAGHRVTVFNRGQRDEALPAGVTSIVGDMQSRADYGSLGERNWDVVVQFIVFTPDQMQQDIEVFSGKTGQYVYISSASVYERSIYDYVTSEARTAVKNPYWPYSQGKIACETLLQGSTLPWTIVRPSQTVRTTLPTVLNEGDAFGYRLLAGKPVLANGDGNSLWTLTRAEDFARPFVNLFGNRAAIHEDFHITGDVGFTWDAIYQTLAMGLGTTANIVHVPTSTIVRYRPEWAGPLLGDKTGVVIYDNSKIKRVAGDFSCETDLAKILSQPVHHFQLRRAAGTPYNTDHEDLMDRIIAEQLALGSD
jgi:nucleoside-diphosphate-sugar epimerase